MVKKLLIVLSVVLSVAGVSLADVMPLVMSDIPVKSIGVYQVSCSKLVIYSKPSLNSRVVFEKTIDYSKYLDVKSSQTFCVILPKKQLSYLYVTDAYDDWIEVLYDKSSGASGWVQKDDLFQFLPWVNFYGMYGRKYGLVPLRSSQQHRWVLHSQADSSSSVVGEVTKPVRIRLTAIEGNWALVSMLDMMGAVHTGYIEWRTQKGEYFVFPEFR